MGYSTRLLSSLPFLPLLPPDSDTAGSKKSYRSVRGQKTTSSRRSKGSSGSDSSQGSETDSDSTDERTKTRRREKHGGGGNSSGSGSESETSSEEDSDAGSHRSKSLRYKSKKQSRNHLLLEYGIIAFLLVLAVGLGIFFWKKSHPLSTDATVGNYTTSGQTQDQYPVPEGNLGVMTSSESSESSVDDDSTPSSFPQATSNPTSARPSSPYSPVYVSTPSNSPSQSSGSKSSSRSAYIPILASTTSTPQSQSSTRKSSTTSRPLSSVPPPFSSSSPAPPPPSPPPPPSSSPISLPPGCFTKNGIGIGWIPDEGDVGGPRQSIQQLNNIIGKNACFMGWYDQLPASGTYSGSNILGLIPTLKASGAIFQPAIMPTNGWNGLTPSNNFQAVAIASVMKQFTDQGITVWLRFGHEINWYLKDASFNNGKSTYQGTVDDFKAGWAAVAAACKSNPKIKMFFTPNVESLSVYKQFYPSDPSTVDIIGIDYYPHPHDTSFLDTMKPFHDAFCTGSSKTVFAIGETGLGDASPIAGRVAWMNEATSSATIAAMPKLVGVTWFNYMKGYDFRLLAVGDESINGPTKAWANS